MLRINCRVSSVIFMDNRKYFVQEQEKNNVLKKLQRNTPFKIAESYKCS